jgi:hypothetical protein
VPAQHERRERERCETEWSRIGRRRELDEGGSAAFFGY